MGIWSTISNRIERVYDWLKSPFRVWRFRTRPSTVIPYNSYGTRQQVHLHGRAIKYRPIRESKATDSLWSNFVNMVRRFRSVELAHAEVHLNVADQAHTTHTNEEGFFHLEVNLDTRAFPQSQTTLPFIAYLTNEMPVEGIAFIPPEDAEFGVISDLDDTVLRSGVMNRFSLLRNTFFYNARTRLPFQGVAEFYQALQAGTKNTSNPIIYLSNSPWNLYDLIEDFLAFQKIPAGPILLADIGITREYIYRSPTHKMDHLRELLALYENLPFILIGDSTQRDAEIYLQAVEEFPGRIPTIYIRDVAKIRNSASAKQMIAHAQNSGSEMIFVEDTAQATQHAIQRGYIQEYPLREIDAN